jgi:hypothetical protein
MSSQKLLLPQGLVSREAAPVVLILMHPGLVFMFCYLCNENSVPIVIETFISSGINVSAGVLKDSKIIHVPNLCTRGLPRLQTNITHECDNASWFPGGMRIELLTPSNSYLEYSASLFDGGVAKHVICAERSSSRTFCSRSVGWSVSLCRWDSIQCGQVCTMDCAERWTWTFERWTLLNITPSMITASHLVMWMSGKLVKYLEDLA